jgi:tetratricopeptide (TPR) repeat protein
MHHPDTVPARLAAALAVAALLTVPGRVAAGQGEEGKGSAPKKESKLLILQRRSVGIEPYREGYRLLERGKLEKARKLFEKARRLDPALHPVYEALSIVYHRLGENEAALEAADKALELSPGEPDYLRIRYEALRGLGREGEAREVLMELGEAAEDPASARLLFNEGVDAVQHGDAELAESLFQAALRLDPEMLQVRDALAKVYFDQRNYESAATMAEEVLGQEPGNRELLRIRQQSYAALGMTERAEAALEELIRFDPGPRTATLLYNQGVEHFNAGDATTAEGYFRRALDLQPSRLDARLGLAEVLLAEDRYDECLELVGEILADEPDNAHAQRIEARAAKRKAAEVRGSGGR